MWCHLLTRSGTKEKSSVWSSKTRRLLPLFQIYLILPSVMRACGVFSLEQEWVPRIFLEINCCWLVTPRAARHHGTLPPEVSWPWLAKTSVSWTSRTGTPGIQLPEWSTYRTATVGHRSEVPEECCIVARRWPRWKCGQHWRKTSVEMVRKLLEWCDWRKWQLRTSRFLSGSWALHDSQE